MLRFIVIGDMHYSETVPYYRIDDYVETRKQKLQEIKDYARNNCVTAILELGDFFDHPKLTAECLSEIFTEWEKNIRFNPKSFGLIPLIGIEGNHELIGAQIDSYGKTSLHLLEASGFLQIASKDNPIIFKDDSGFTVAITGSPYDREVDRCDNKDAYAITKKEGDIHIHLTHGLLMNKSFGKKFAHTTIHELEPKTVADITINGHDHIGFPTTELNGKWFANPGSVMRMKAENNEISRMPKFMVVEIHDDLSIHFEDVYFKCAKAGDQVLSTDHLELKKHKTNHLARIQALVNQAESQTGLKISDIIDNIGNTQGIDKDILNTAKQKIVEAMNTMEKPYSPSGEYYIQRVELENFLSHKNSTFDFTNGLNILAGESRSGKSAVLRAITEVYLCNIPQPRDAITFNEDYFKITLTLSNGYIITRKVERKERGENGYEVYNPNTGNVEVYNTKAVEYIQELLGMREIQLSEKGKDSVNINFLPQDAGWFYSNMTGPNRAKLLGTIYGTNYADAAIRNYNNLIKTKNAEVAKDKRELERYTEEQKKYSKLPELEELIKNAEIQLKEIEALNKIIDKAQTIIKEMQTLRNQMEQLQKIIQKLSINLTPQYQALEKDYERLTMAQKTIAEMQRIKTAGQTARMLQTTLTPLKAIDVSELRRLEQEREAYLKKFEILMKLKQQMNDIQQAMIKLQKQTSKLQGLQAAEDSYKQLTVLAAQLEQQSEKTKKAKAIATELKSIYDQGITKRKIINALRLIVEKESTFTGLVKNRENLAKGKILTEDIKKIQTQSKTISMNIQAQQETLSHQIQTYRKKLTETSSCPICQTQINQETIEKIISSL